MTKDNRISMHIASLLENRPHSFCIISDNAHSIKEGKAKAMSTNASPRRAKSATRNSLPSRINRPYSSKRALPTPRRRITRAVSHGSRDDDDDNDSRDEPTRPTANTTASPGLSRWSSSPKKQADRSMTKPPRRGLSNDSKVQLRSLAASSSSSRPPSMPTRKLLDDECSTSASNSFTSTCSASSMPPYMRSDMSLTHCLVQTKSTVAGSSSNPLKKDKHGKNIRSIRRPGGRSSEEKRRTIVDILDAALDSLDLEVQ